MAAICKFPGSSGSFQGFHRSSVAYDAEIVKFAWCKPGQAIAFALVYIAVAGGLAVGMFKVSAIWSSWFHQLRFLDSTAQSQPQLEDVKSYSHINHLSLSLMGKMLV